MVLLVRLTVVLGNLMVDMCMFIGALCEASRKGLVLSNFNSGPAPYVCHMVP